MSGKRTRGLKLDAENQLAKKLQAQIEQHGPITLHDYMEACLADPEFGYYIVRDPFGSQGDFITAPDICQVFGELLGLWCVQVWADMGQPYNCKLIELGPGRGALMSDALRAASLVPTFLNSIEVHFVETSKALRKVQEERIRSEAIEHGRELPAMFWHDRLKDVPAGPSLILANEFIDALPIHQYQYKRGEWFERMVGLNKDGGFAFELAHEVSQRAKATILIPKHPVEGDRWEDRPASNWLVAEIAMRARSNSVAGLIIDYGYSEAGFGDSFQALKQHRFVNPLKDPGMADVTAHVDFSRLSDTAKSKGLTVFGPVSQRDFLIALGARERTAQLLEAQENMKSAGQFMTGLLRLIEPDQMGSLFKVIALTGPDQPQVQGFEELFNSQQSYLG